MKTIFARPGLGIGLVAIFAAASMAGCASYKQEAQKTTSRGAEMQQSGTMSQSDYIRISALGHQVYQTHSISDANLDWTLNFLNSAKNPIARARAMTTLSEIRPMSAAQKAKILPAIAPFLNSADTLDQTGAKRVQKVTQASG